MKGKPVFLQYSYRAAVVQILSHLSVKFEGVDALRDLGIRWGTGNSRASRSTR